MNGLLVFLGSIGFLCSLFYGIFAVRIFLAPARTQPLPPNHWTWYVHQFIFNFVGSAVGWLCLMIFAKIAQESGAAQIRAGHYLLLVPAVIGMVGWLPTTVAGVVRGLAGAMAAVIDKLASKM